MAIKMMAAMLLVGTLCVIVESAPAPAESLYEKQTQLFSSMLKVEPASSKEADMPIKLPANVAQELAMAKAEFKKANALNYKWNELQSKKHVSAKMAIPPRMAREAFNNYLKYMKNKTKRDRQRKKDAKKHPMEAYYRKSGRPPHRENFAASSGKCRVSHWGTWSTCKNPCSHKNWRVRWRFVKRRHTKFKGPKARLGCHQHARQRMKCYSDAKCREYRGSWAGKPWKVKTFAEALKKEGLPLLTADSRNKHLVASQKFVAGRRRRTKPWKCTHPNCHHTLEGPAFYEHALVLKAYMNLAADPYLTKYGNHATETGCLGGLVRAISDNRNSRHPQRDYDDAMKKLRRTYNMGIPKYMLSAIERSMSHGKGIVKFAHPNYGGRTVFATLDYKTIGLELQPKMLDDIKVKASALKAEKKRLEHSIYMGWSAPAAIHHTIAKDVPQGRHFNPCDCTGSSVRGGLAVRHGKTCARRKGTRCVKWVHGSKTRQIGQHCARWNKNDRMEWCVVDKRCDRAFPTRDRRHKWNYCHKKGAALTPWTSWGKCSRKCGGGFKHRHRKVLSMGTSKKRPATRQSRPCNLRPCHGKISKLTRRELVRGVKTVVSRARRDATALEQTGDGDSLFFDIMGEA